MLKNKMLFLFLIFTSLFFSGCQQNDPEIKYIGGEVILIKGKDFDEKHDKMSKVSIGYGKNDWDYLCSPKNYVKSGEIEWEEKEGYFIGKYHIELSEDEITENEYVVTYGCGCKYINIKQNEYFNIDFIISEGIHCAG